MSTLLTLIAQSDPFLPDKGPPTDGDFRISPNVFIAMFFAGFIIGVGGHVYKSKTTVAIGITLIMVATVLAPIFIAATH